MLDAVARGFERGRDGIAVGPTETSPFFAGRRVAVLNWRDAGHPNSGGAEAFAVEVCRTLARSGASVEFITARHKGAAAHEERDGYIVRRAGGTFGVYLAAGIRLAWRRFVRRDIDVVIDCANGIPFFAPLFAPGVPVVCVIHHVHQDQFREHFGPFLAFVGRLSEGLFSRLVYRRAAFAAVSASTRRGVTGRLRIARPIVVVPNGRGGAVTGQLRPAMTSRIVCVARLVPHKQVDLLLEAIAILVARGFAATLDVVGDGPERMALEALSVRLGLESYVSFIGHVSDAERDGIMSRASVLAIPSSREGWGLTVLEAAAMGVPSVGLRVPGVSDAIIDGETGWLADPSGGATALADTLERALIARSDMETSAAISAAARAWASSFTWERTVERLATAASIAARHTAERGFVPMVITGADVSRVEIDARDEVARCDHGILILTWTADVAAAARRALAFGGICRPATDAEMHAGPRCNVCPGGAR